MVDAPRLFAAYRKVRRDLLSQRAEQGHFTGCLSASALSTATAVSALAIVLRNTGPNGSFGQVAPAHQSVLEGYIQSGLRWLVEHQNGDGGWGDTDRSYSNIATTMLGTAAFRLAGRTGDCSDLLERADGYIQRSGGIAALRLRYGEDRTFAVPILTNAALAGSVAWREVPPLPFELACLPQSFYRWARLPVVSYAIPALVAIGQARFLHDKPRNPLVRLLRGWSVERSLGLLARMQPASGGYLEAIPLTSFVIMSLASTGRASHPVVERGVRFLLTSARADGSWPIDTNLATWNTTLAINALAASGAADWPAEVDCIQWLMDCQHKQVHPYTGAQAGGWGWSDLSGAVPDADDTAGALLAMHCWRRDASPSPERLREIHAAASQGAEWLLRLQNADGGWPTFCRGWGKMPFDRSGTDLTAHALRALHAWRDVLNSDRVSSALSMGLRFLSRRQNADGSWMPLWFGNQEHQEEANPVYGTSKVLLAYRDLGKLGDAPAQRGLAWLRGTQNADGGFNSGNAGRRGGVREVASSVEETALAVEALLGETPAVKGAIAGGLSWLVGGIEREQHHNASPIGLYFAKLWYYEKLYPYIFATSALGHAVGIYLGNSVTSVVGARVAAG